MLSSKMKDEVNAILSDRKYWETAVCELLNSMYAPLDDKGNIIEDCQAVTIYKKQKGIL